MGSSWNQGTSGEPCPLLSCESRAPWKAVKDHRWHLEARAGLDPLPLPLSAGISLAFLKRRLCKAERGPGSPASADRSAPAMRGNLAGPCQFHQSVPSPSVLVARYGCLLAAVRKSTQPQQVTHFTLHILSPLPMAENSISRLGKWKLAWGSSQLRPMVPTCSRSPGTSYKAETLGSPWRVAPLPP